MEVEGATKELNVVSRELPQAIPPPFFFPQKTVQGGRCQVSHVSPPPPISTPGHAGSVADHDTYSSPGTPKGPHTMQMTLMLT